MVVLTALLSLLAAPAAQAHFEPSSLARPVPGAAALAASTKIEFERAPREVHGQCATTEAIAGLGNACATSGGLFRLKLRDGSSLTTHGFDGPQPDAFNTYMTGSSQALSNASVNNIECVNAATTKHTTLIYAYPPGQSSRYGTIAPLLRTESYKMSAFLDAESRSVDASKGLKIPLECDGSGTPVVLEVQTATPTGSDSFDSIVSDLRADGYGASTSLVAKDRYVVFYDASIGNGYAGTGHLYADRHPILLELQQRGRHVCGRVQLGERSSLGRHVARGRAQHGCRTGFGSTNVGQRALHRRVRTSCVTPTAGPTRTTPTSALSRSLTAAAMTTSTPRLRLAHTSIHTGILLPHTTSTCCT